MAALDRVVAAPVEEERNSLVVANDDKGELPVPAAEDVDAV